VVQSKSARSEPLGIGHWTVTEDGEAGFRRPRALANDYDDDDDDDEATVASRFSN